MIRGALALTRPGVSLAVGVSALAGWILASTGTHAAAAEGMAVFTGAFALSAAVSVLNQIQERYLDALMERTRQRPLASGRMGVVQGLTMFGILLLPAAVGLWPGLGLGSLVAILIVLGLYNGLYTYLKPVTGWAMIPGSVCGALPFWIGWLAGGGELWAVEPVFFFALYFTWQMPHFWMLAETNAQDYAAAGFPVPANSFSSFSRQAIPRLWALALAVLAGMAPLFGLLTHPGYAHALATICPAYGVAALLAKPRALRVGSDGFLVCMLALGVAERLAG